MECVVEESAQMPSADQVETTADLVAAYVSNNSVRPADLPELIASIHAALTSLGTPATPAAEQVEKPTPAEIKRSIKPDALVSFIDGKPYKTLKRHLTKHGLDLQSYRERYGLPPNYPSTAANYSAQRSALAKNLGLGQQRREPDRDVNTAEAASAPTKAKGRKNAREAAEAE
jgi:predicted transcriptional regulator